MRKSEMNEEQLGNRHLFVSTLEASGWKSMEFNQQFDEGLWVSPEASMEYFNQTLTLRLDFVCKDSKVILYLDSEEGKSLGLVFKCLDCLKPLLDAIIRMQNSVSPANVSKKAEELLAACPEIFKISGSGDKLIPIKANKSK